MSGGAGSEAAGAVAIWHDIVPEGLAEFRAWHGEEHMPERVAIPGFVSGRRFAALGTGPGFFNLYQTRSLAVLAGPDYRQRLDSPTPRTLSAVRHFRNVARALCRVAAAGGVGGGAEGGLVATLRIDTDGDAARTERALAELGGILPRLAAAPGIAAVRLLAADLALSGYVNAEQRARGAPNLVPAVALIVEGWADEAPFAATLREALGRLGGTLDLFRLEATVARR
jgi:hypothetical protein